MSRGTQVIVRGHEIGAASSGSPAPYDAQGDLIDGPRTAPGYARCVCGELSPEPFQSAAARYRWLKIHREEIAKMPWSDAARAAVNWPEIFAERGIGDSELTTWEESAPGCWTGFYSPAPASPTRWYVVTDDASGLCLATVGSMPKPASAWLAMADALAEMLHHAGYVVTCAVPDCEYGRWPCPVRVAWAVTVNPSLGAWNGTDDAARHRPISNGKADKTGETDG